ncbi:unnamed protein product [Peniophora sp. CBMAI 1063]|nr:unnamed protein product [Peniophora sp. CBMAI 1063]
MRAPSLLACTAVYAVAAASASQAREHARRDATFSSPNGMKMMPMATAGSPSDPSIMTLMNDQDTKYLVNITLGGSVFTVQYDTGSTDLVLIPDKPITTTSVVQGSNVSQTYGTGFYAGSIAFAKLEFGNYVVDSQAYLNATQVDAYVTANILPEGVRGIMGFDAGVGTTNLQVELFQEHGDQGLATGRTFLGNIFAASPDLGNFTVVILGRSDDGERAGEGYFAIGEYPDGLKESFSKVNYVDSTGTTGGHFSVVVDAVSVNGKELPLNSSVSPEFVSPGKAVATLDTGAGAGFVTQDFYDAIYSSIPGAFYSADVSAYIVPCLPPSGAPNITISIGGQDIYINPLDLISVNDLRPEGYNLTFCSSAFALLDLGAGFSGMDYLLGDPFLRNVYTSFYYGSFNASGYQVKAPAVKLVPETQEVDATYADFLSVRGKKLASSPPEATRAQIEKIIAASMANTTTDGDASIAEDVASAVSSDSDGSSYQSLLDKLDTFAPIVFGLLGAIFVALLGLLGVGVALCIRRGRTVGAARSGNTFYSPVPAPVRFKEPVPEYKDEEHALYGQ